jgi:hypothetical protein
MATNTYVALDTRTLSSNTASVTLNMGATLSQAYTSLEIVITGGFVSNNDEVVMQFNGDTASNYSTSFLFGDGGSPLATRQSSTSSINCGRIGSTALKGFSKISINNYSSTNTYKSVIARSGGNTGVNGGSGGYMYLNLGMWRSNSAITSITLFEAGGNSWLSGTTFQIFGISNAGDATSKATGGDVYQDATYWYHAFPMSGNFVPLQSLTADVLVVAGGGAGGYYYAGAGGGGGVAYQTGRSITSACRVLIGAGGANPGTTFAAGGSGGNSIFDTITANGGGGGGFWNSTGNNGVAGGSGGGGSMGTGSGNTTAGGAATQGTSGGATGYGNAGGGGLRSGSFFGGGGGGGAGAVGTAAVSTTAGSGGVGITNSTINTLNAFGAATSTGQLSGGNYFYAGGGGGGAEAGTAGTGGTGGGGNGGTQASGGVTAGTVSTGGGGGAGGGQNLSANGGSGIVIVRYTKA